MTRFLGVFLAAGAVLAAAQAAAVVVGLMLALALVYGLFTHPRELFGLLGFGLLVGLIERHPLACLGFAALMIVAKIFLHERT